MTLTPSRRTDRSLLYLIVSLTGAAVMVIELLGTRLIAPFYGTSLYVWSSLISVTMIALAAGYFAGGRWADHSGGRGLPVVIAGAGLLTVLIPLAARWVLLATDPLGLRAGAFVSALLLFFPALSLLGMVSPLAIKQATERLAGVAAEPVDRRRRQRGRDHPHHAADVAELYRHRHGGRGAVAG